MKAFSASILAFTAIASETLKDMPEYRDENSVNVIANAITWLNPPVPYSQQAYYNGYRADCSGYVSMAWQLGWSASTWTIPDYSYPIYKSQLKAGDILLNINEHVLIFSSWANSAQTQYWAFEQTPPQTVYHVVDYPYWAGYDEWAYTPYRFYGNDILMKLAVGVVQAENMPLEDIPEYRDENSINVIANAKTWLNPSVPYSQQAYHNGYRTDCSGYVSMAWQLGWSASTWTIPDYSSPISKSQLKAGDVLLNINEHVLIFSSWANSAQTQYWAYEQTPPGTVYHVVDYPYWAGYDEWAYQPYRLYGNGVEQAPNNQ